MTPLHAFNNMASTEALQAISQCCAAQKWANAMVNARPFSNLDSVLVEADRAWVAMIEADLLEAFSAHPQIGNVATLREKYANTKALAANEQSLVADASDETIDALAKANTAYLAKFGFIFIVCATGKSAQDMLTLIESRLLNDRPTELINAAEEQRKITALRLQKWLG